MYFGGVKAIITNKASKTKPVQMVKVPALDAQQISVIFTTEPAFSTLICQTKIANKKAKKFSTNAERKSAGENKSAGKVLLGENYNGQNMRTPKFLGQILQ